MLIGKLLNLHGLMSTIKGFPIADICMLHSIAQFVTLTNAVINCGFKPNEGKQFASVATSMLY